VEEQPRDHCIRCGTCCRSGSPTLHVEDVDIVRKGIIGLEDLYTIRRGEVVRANVHGGGLALVGTERVKVREREEPPCPGACVFYHHPERACTIYEHRPAQCAALECWDQAAFLEVYDHPRAERKHVIEDARVLNFLAEHEERCGLPRVDRAVKRMAAEGQKAVGDLIGVLQEDHQMRQEAVQELGVPENTVEFFLGRPLTRVLHQFGLRVKERADGSLLLKRLD
jgi:Fe-S-cluster containining protein